MSALISKGEIHNEYHKTRYRLRFIYTFYLFLFLHAWPYTKSDISSWGHNIIMAYFRSEGGL